jgi:hypothetical protein
MINKKNAHYVIPYSLREVIFNGNSTQGHLVMQYLMQYPTESIFNPQDHKIKRSKLGVSGLVPGYGR